MTAPDPVYRDLQRHLDRQVVGYPATRSGVEIRILQRLFTPDEARLALHLTYRPATAEDVWRSAEAGGFSLDLVERMLETMALKGAVGRVDKGGTRRFRTMPLVVGMYEYQLDRLTPESVGEFKEYFGNRAFGLAMVGSGVPQMRTIPVEKSLPVEQYVTTYDHLTDILQTSAGPFVILECICRKSAGLKGHPCTKTSRLETCMALGEMATIAVESDTGRAISREEALEIARMNQADGLVLQPSNTQQVDFVCACCGCCCGMLGMQKALPKPVDFWASNYFAAVDADACTACGTCVERCQVGAVSVDDGFGAAVVDLDRCIGCGNCVVTCPPGALTLVNKGREVVPPEDTEALYETMMAHKAGPLGRARLAAKIVLGR